MKTQISIQVKNASIFARPIIFSKAKVNMFIDSADAQPVVLKSRTEPYMVDVTPGEHTVVFTDASAKFKGAIDKMIGAAFGAGLGLGGGGAFGGAFGAKEGAGIMSAITGTGRVHNNQLQCVLKEGDTLKVKVQPKRSGKVSVKIL
jgi:hypothetical protein